jgi:hypothetical protein
MGEFFSESNRGRERVLLNAKFKLRRYPNAGSPAAKQKTETLPEAHAGPVHLNASFTRSIAG